MGLGGGGIRIGGKEMDDLLPSTLSLATDGYMPTPLPMGMRRIQQAAATFNGDFTLGFDYASYRPLPLNGRVAFTGTTKSFIAAGSADADQGMVYITQDLNRTVGIATGASIAISGLHTGDYVDYEIWSTGQDARQLDFQFAVQVVNGKLTIPLPDFNRDLMVRFKVERW
jgi:hypothetical protein